MWQLVGKESSKLSEQSREIRVGGNVGREVK